VAPRTARGPQGDDLGVRGGVGVGFAAVGGSRQNATARIQDDRADRYVTGRGRGGLVQRQPHGRLEASQVARGHGITAVTATAKVTGQPAG
jgi:hypothetical protein